MNILIKGMEKPKSCYSHCLEDFIANKEIGCPLNDYIESHQYKDRIHPDCPLIEIPQEDEEAVLYLLRMRKAMREGKSWREFLDEERRADGDI